MLATEECRDYIDNITFGKNPYMLLFYLNPVRSSVWQPRSSAWLYTFKFYSAIFSLLFFMVGTLSIVIAIKRNCHRLKTKTFIAVYTCLAIFGISRAIHLSTDPHGIIGWIVEYFPQWVIISRALAVLGFPSFSAAYVLVFITLYKSTDISSSRLWHQDWRVIISIVIVNYAIAVIAEVIANSAAYPALLSIVVCNFVFSVWGIIICVVYIFSGSRLLRKLKKQHVKSMRMSASFADDKGRKLRRKHRAQSSEDIFYNKNYERRYNKIAQTVRKITIITFFSAAMGVIYSLMNFGTLIFTCWLIFEYCIGLNEQGNPTVWLILQIIISIVEIPLVIIMLYSVTDLSGVMKEMLKLCHCRIEVSKTSPPMPPTLPQGPSQISFDSGQLSASPLPSLTFLPPVPSVPPPPLPSYKIIDIHSSMNDSLDEQV